MKALWGLVISEAISGVLMLFLAVAQVPHLGLAVWLRVYLGGAGLFGIYLAGVTFTKIITLRRRRETRDWAKEFEEEDARSLGVAGEDGHRDRTSVPRQP